MSDDPVFDALCQRNDAWRKASPADHSDEIEMLTRALLNPTPYTSVGLRNMKQRLLLLKAAAGLIPTKS